MRDQCSGCGAPLRSTRARSGRAHYCAACASEHARQRRPGSRAPDPDTILERTCRRCHSRYPATFGECPECRVGTLEARKESFRSTSWDERQSYVAKRITSHPLLLGFVYRKTAGAACLALAVAVWIQGPSNRTLTKSIIATLGTIALLLFALEAWVERGKRIKAQQRAEREAARDSQRGTGQDGSAARTRRSSRRN